MSKNLWTACLAGSLFLHFLLLHTGYAPREVTGKGDITIPISFDVQPQTTQSGFALRQSISEDLASGEEGGNSPQARRKRALRRYLIDVRKEIERQKFLGAQECRKTLIGNVRYSLTITADGLFANVHLMRSSGDPRLDRAGITAIKNSSGKVPRPRITGTIPLNTTVTVKYQYGL